MTILASLASGSTGTPPRCTRLSSSRFHKSAAAYPAEAVGEALTR